MASLIRKLYTLVLVRKADEILLGYKKRGFGQGKWNLFGGKVEEGETPAEAAVRELREESGVVAVGGAEKVGEIEFTFEGENTLMHVMVFSVPTYKGDPVETEEMRPQWFPLDSIPYDKMWPDDYLWYPIVLRGGKFKGAFHFKGHDTILSQNLREVESLE